jgi:hypothetical protein
LGSALCRSFSITVLDDGTKSAIFFLRDFILLPRSQSFSVGSPSWTTRHLATVF